MGRSFYIISLGANSANKEKEEKNMPSTYFLCLCVFFIIGAELLASGCFFVKEMLSEIFVTKINQEADIVSLSFSIFLIGLGGVILFYLLTNPAIVLSFGVGYAMK